MTIEDIIARDFEIAEDREAVSERANTQLEEGKGNLLTPKLVRSLLLLAEGSREKFESFFPVWDARDYVMEAMRKPKKLQQSYGLN